MDVEQAIQVLFDRLTARGPEPSLQNVAGTCEFDIDGCVPWYVTFDAGSVTASPNPLPATCKVMCRAADFVDMAEGRQNMLIAVLQGRVRARGDLSLGMSFRRLLPVTR
jgi:hypothetical protein